MDNATKVVDLSEKISSLCEGHTHFIAVNATINVSAMTIVSASGTRQEAEASAGKFAEMLSTAVIHYWVATNPN